MRFNSHYQGQELICHHQQPSQWFSTAVCGLMDNAHTHIRTLEYVHMVKEAINVCSCDQAL